MKKLLFIIFGLFGVVQAQTIGYLRYDSVKLEKPGSSTELILENSTKGVTGGFLKNTGNGRTAFVVPPSGIDSITRIAGVDSFYYWKNGVSYAVKDSTGGGGIDSTTASNGLTLSGKDIKLGGTLTGATTITGGGYDFTWNNGGFISFNSVNSAARLTDLSSGVTATVDVGGGAAELISQEGSIASSFIVNKDKIEAQPYMGQLFIDTLTNDVGTHALRYNPTTGLVSYADTTAAGANTALSNLASVAINTSLLPGTDNAIDLGSSSKTFKDGYFTGKIGIGNTSPTYDIDLKKTVNGSIGFSVLNESGGASAAAVFNLYRSYGAQYGVQHYYAGEGNTIYTPLSYNMINDVGSTGGMFLNNLASAPIGFLTNNTRRMTILGNGNVGIGESSPSALFSVGSGSKFQVDGNGNVVKLNNVTTSFPSSNSSGVLSNNGSGTLTWATPYIAKTGITTLTGNVAVDIDRTGSGPFKFTIEDNGNRFFTTDKATDTYGFGDLDNAFDNTYMKVVGSVGYIRSSAIASGSTGDAITLVDPSTGELGVAPNLTFNLKKEGTMIYAKNGRIFAEDNSGNNTQISPHNDKGEWIYKSTDKNGVTTEINMIRLAELLEKITGEKLIYKSTDK